MKYTTTLFCLCLVLSDCFGQNKQSVQFNVEITVYTHGTHKLLSYKLTNNTILAIKHSTNNEPDSTIVNRTLTETEKVSVHNFMKGFPLNDLKKEYANRDVEGEIHRIFDITINTTHKRILVYFQKQENLDALTEEISRLLPEETTTF